jgi:hypothetical protein
MSGGPTMSPVLRVVCLGQHLRDGHQLWQRPKWYLLEVPVGQDPALLHKRQAAKQLPSPVSRELSPTVHCQWARPGNCV